jgi:chromosome segregation ATPase
MSLQHARAAQYYANRATQIDTYSAHMRTKLSDSSAIEDAIEKCKMEMEVVTGEIDKVNRENQELNAQFTKYVATTGEARTLCEEKYSKLQEEHQKLQIDKETLQSDKEALRSKAEAMYDDLQREYEALRSAFQELLETCETQKRIIALAKTEPKKVFKSFAAMAGANSTALKISKFGAKQENFSKKTLAADAAPG